MQYPTQILFSSSKECYIIGKDNGNAVIAKSADFGQNWSKFDTGISGELLQMAFLSDSVALLSGKSGLLLRWNFKSAVFTLISSINDNVLEVKVFPNPSKDVVFVEVEQNFVLYKITLYNTLGQERFKILKPLNKQQIEISNLPSGIYFIKIQSLQGDKVFKIVKE